MKNKLIKVKRKAINWYRLLLSIGDLNHSEIFWSIKNRHPRMSNNRIAWNVLKRYYSTTTLAYVRMHGGTLESLLEYQKFCLGCL